MGATTMGEAETLARAAQTSPEAQTLVEQVRAGETRPSTPPCKN